MTGMIQDHHLPALQDFESLGTSMWDLLWHREEYWAAWGFFFWKRRVSPSFLGVFFGCFGFFFGWVLVFGCVCLFCFGRHWLFALTYSLFDDRLASSAHGMSPKKKRFVVLTRSTDKILELHSVRLIVFPCLDLPSTHFRLPVCDSSGLCWACRCHGRNVLLVFKLSCAQWARFAGCTGRTDLLWLLSLCCAIFLREWNDLAGSVGWVASTLLQNEWDLHVYFLAEMNVVPTSRGRWSCK